MESNSNDKSTWNWWTIAAALAVVIFARYKYLQYEDKLKEAERAKLEEKKRAEAAQREQEKKERQLQEERERKKREEEEKQKRDEENRLQEEKRKEQEEKYRQQREAEAQKLREEQRQRAEEERRREEERKRQEEEERKKKEEAEILRKKLEEEENQRKEEEERKRKASLREAGMEWLKTVDVLMHSPTLEAALHTAIENNNLELVEKIVQYEPDLNALEPRGVPEREPYSGMPGTSWSAEHTITPLHRAMEKKNLVIMQLLIRKGADINKTGKYDGHRGGTPREHTLLHRAAINGDTVLLKMLLENKADANVRDFFGDTPLHVAAEMNRLEVIEILVKVGRANPDVVCPQWEYASCTTPLATAAEKGDITLVSLLLSLGATLLAGVLNKAVKGGHPEAVKFLLEKGADPKAEDNVPARACPGKTALHFLDKGTPMDHEKIIEMLVGAGADINARADDDSTPLSSSAWLGLDTIKILVKFGADVNWKCRYFGRTQTLLDKYKSLNAKEEVMQFIESEIQKQQQQQS